MKKLIALILILAVLTSMTVLPVRAAALTGKVLLAVNTDLSDDTLTVGSFLSEDSLLSRDDAPAAPAVISDGIAATADGWSVSDVITNADGSTTEVRSPIFAPMVPVQGEPASGQYSTEQTYASYTTGSTFEITDNLDAARPMQCLYIGDHCTVWGSTGDNAAICISASNARSIGDAFDSYYDRLTSAFGTWYDADRDGKLAIFCYDIDNDYGKTVSSYTAGFFRPMDLVDPSGRINGINFGTNSYTGMGLDCIHLDTYPGMNSTSVPLDYISKAYSTLVHEAQHLINFSYQVAGGTYDTYYDSMEIYLNEAFSMAAEHLICGAEACSSRIRYFNGNSYVPGTALTHWDNTLSHYSNSYLFGQYLRTRRSDADGTDGSNLFRQVLEGRQLMKGGNTLELLAPLLYTTPQELVTDFWSAVYLREGEGNHGFCGESWANSLSPRIYSSITSAYTGNIYNGGAKYYTLPAAGFTPSSVNGVELIALGVDDAANAMATVTTGSTTVSASTVAEMTAAVSSTGNSVVTLHRDITTGSTIVFPYSCTIDLAGHTITTNLTTGNGLQILSGGSQNSTTTVKNGRLRHYEVGIRLNVGNLVVSNMTIESGNGACIGIYDNCNASHFVTVRNSRLSSPMFGCISFNKSNANLSNYTVNVENTVMVSHRVAEKGQAVIVRQSGTTPGRIVFGKGVEMYSYYNTFDEYPFSPEVFTNVSGETVTKAAGTFSAEAAGQTYTGLFKWTTPAAAAIAEVTTGGTTVTVTNRDELFDALSSTGNSVVKLLKDVTESTTCKFPYTCTLDLNGHTWKTDGAGNAVWILKAGTENTHTVVKNGTLDAYVLGVRIDFGAGTVAVENCTVISRTSSAIGLYDNDTSGNSKNVISGCTLISIGGSGCFSWNSDAVSTGNPVQRGMNVTITNTKLVQPQTNKYIFYCRNASAAANSNTVTLGDNVEIYTANPANLCISSVALAGKALTTAAGTHSITVAGTSYTGLTKLTTPANAIATVTTGGATVNVKSVDELTAAISPTGNSVVTLLSDITYTTAVIRLPYSCTVDFNGHTLRTNTTQYNCLQILAAGSENRITTLKNGTMIYHTVGARVDGGGIVVQDMTMYSYSGTAVAINDPSGDYKDVNRIENSTLISTEWGPVAFNRSNYDFSATGITIANSTLVSLKTADTAANIIVRQSTTTCGTVTIGAGVRFYNYRTNSYAAPTVVVTGALLEKITESASFTHEGLGLSAAGLTLWQSNAEKTGVSIVTEKPEGGTLYVPSMALPGQTVTVTYTADEGYTFSHLLVNGQPAAGLTVTVPETGPLTISAVFKPAAVLTVLSCVGGIVTLPKTTAAYGEAITASAVPEEGYEFVALLVNGAAVNGLTFTVPASPAVTVQGCFSAVLPDPAAAVTNGEITVDVRTLEDAAALIAPDGNTVVTLLRDYEISGTQALSAPNSFTLDLSGFTLSSTTSNALQVNGIGTENTTTVVKNGTILSAILGVRVDAGSLHLENVTVHGHGTGPAVGYYETSGAYNDDNLIVNSTLVSAARGAFSFNHASQQQSAASVTIRDSVLVTRTESGVPVLESRTGGGTVILSDGVSLYTCASLCAESDVTLSGDTLLKDKTLQHLTLPALSLELTNLNRWYTEGLTTISFGPLEVPQNTLAWAAVYGADHRMLTMLPAAEKDGVWSVTAADADIRDMVTARLFLLQNETFIPLQAPVSPYTAPAPAPETPTEDDAYREIPGREVSEFGTKLFAEPASPWTVSLRVPADWVYTSNGDAAGTFLRNGSVVGQLMPGDSAPEDAWTVVASRTLVYGACRTHEFVEKTGTGSTLDFRRRYVYENPGIAKYTLIVPHSECGEAVIASLYSTSRLLQAYTDPGMNRLEELQGGNLLMLGNSFIATSEIGRLLGSMFSKNGKTCTVNPISRGYATVQTFAEDAALLSSIRSGTYDAVFLCGLYSTSQVAHVATVKAACDESGTRLILLPAYNESRAAIELAAKTYTTLPILDWKGEVETFIATGCDKWDFCIDDAHTHSTPLAGYVGAHMIYRGIYGQVPAAFPDGSVTEAKVDAVLGSYPSTGRIWLIPGSLISDLFEYTV